MTEAGWLSETRDPRDMLSHLALLAKYDDRRARLLKCHLAYDAMPGDRWGGALLADVERHAERPTQKTKERMSEVRALARSRIDRILGRSMSANWEERIVPLTGMGAALERRVNLGTLVFYAASTNAKDGTLVAGPDEGWPWSIFISHSLARGGPADEAARVQRDWIRELWGNPFRPRLSLGGIMRAALKGLDSWTAAQPEAEEVFRWYRHDDRKLVRLVRRVVEEQAFRDLPVIADVLEEAGCTDAALLGHLRQDVKHGRGCWALDYLAGRY